MDILTEKDLKPGDVLLYHSTSLIGWLIRRFDGTDYGHASIYKGGDVRSFVESLPGGIVAHNLVETSKGDAYIHVFRFKKNGHALGDDGYPANLIVQVISNYLGKGTRYGYADLLLLAGIMEERHLKSPIVDKIIESAAKFIAHRLQGKNAMVCSSFVYRCFDEADPASHTYQLTIDPLRRSERGLHLVGALLDALPEMIKLLKFIVADAWGVNSHNLQGADPHEIVRRTIVTPDFVTPGDLSLCADLEVIGTLDFPGRSEQSMLMLGNRSGTPISAGQT